MQEEIDEKTMALVITGGKISAEIMKEAMAKFIRHEEQHRRMRKELKSRKKEEIQPGKTSLNSMMKEGSQLSNIEVTDKNIRSFEKTARKYGITYSLKKDRASDPPRYLVFFRARDVDVMTAAFKEYTEKSLKKEKKVSVRKKLSRAIERSVKHRERVKTKTKDRGHDR